MKQLALFLLLNVLWFAPSHQPIPKNQDSPYLCAANTLAMNARLCIDITEVPGYMYKDYLATAAENESINSPSFKARKPDFDKWKEVFENLNEVEIESKFFESDEFALMPIVGISRKQAEDFCAWRTKMFQAELDKMSKRERAQFPKKFRFRLPTANEWSRMRFLAQEKRMMKQLDKIADGNLKAFKFSKATLMRGNEKISHIYNAKDSKVGFFNLFDNVSEMTSEDGIAVGGSWVSPNTEENYQQTFEYSGPAAWLGFRCVFEIID
ncbi:hypothetical protein BFP97_00805 [Roseivirga sp. 4D4]|uniref:SUMF1/EgtB/PvdO family nonheme iron enzyme n=1 Tax=Roseivirga sp. 4D4 TaxID=1889784 RepID=UPI0008535F12|nr:SUMF1/EgtB/PvdO family nonheme iron enzyme [Roseivirga sp. 4D4]OEK00142.1 hypothetical protein BFP97_00805 [Roseivirga sp. 4D4]